MDRVAEDRRIDEMLAQQYGRRGALKQDCSVLTYELLEVPERIVFVDHLRNHAYKLVRDPRFSTCGENQLASEQDPVEA